MQRALIAVFLIAAHPALPDEAAVKRMIALYDGEGSTDLVVETAGGVVTSAKNLPCMSCHGGDGSGGREGAAVIPPISATALERDTARRPAYSAETLARAVRDGIAAGERRLDSTMPRYRINPGDEAALLTAIRAINARERSGVAPGMVTFSIAGQGLSQAARASFVAGMEAAWQRRGSPKLHGRLVRFVAEERGDAFAMLFGAVAPGGAPSSEPAMPLLFPLRGAVSGSWVRGLQADEVTQWRALVAAAGDKAEIVADDGAQRALREWRIVPSAQFRSAPSTGGDQPLVLFGAREFISSWLQRMPANRSVFIAFDDIAAIWDEPRLRGREVQSLDPRKPASDQRGLDQARMFAVAAYIIDEALAQSGRDLTRSGFLRSIDTLRLEDPAWPILDYRRFRGTGTQALTRVTLTMGASTQQR